jgi:hypothetical protein
LGGERIAGEVVVDRRGLLVGALQMGHVLRREELDLGEAEGVGAPVGPRHGNADMSMVLHFGAGWANDWVE